jgi:hypothetical protein|uniref:Uncharacterized protein n=1 Tax=Mimiviridae sp. ChoanoV1 TaxID=2596887 RepID=A0A5B8IIT9_9VIRU|nr:hypothetical protein 5_9 [Mimiviridae sp. ChoanoV1]
MKLKNIVIKLIKNEYLTYFMGVFTIIFVNEILNSKNNTVISLIKYFLNNRVILGIIAFIIIFVSYYNLPLSLLLFTNLIFLLKINFKIETFENRIENLVDKNSLLSYKKNFAKLPKKKQFVKKTLSKKNNEIKKKNVPKKNIKKRKEQKRIISYYDESKNTKNEERLNSFDLKKELNNLKDENKKNTNTLEDDLKKKHFEKKKDLDILDLGDYSSESSESNQSTSESSDSSDSEAVADVSMEDAREHVMKKIRNKIKKKYVKKEKYQ